MIVSLFSPPLTLLPYSLLLDEYDQPSLLPEEHDPPPPPPPPSPSNHHHQENCCIAYQRRTQPQINIPHLCELVIIPKLKETMDFVSALSTATLTDPVAKFGPKAWEHLCNPPCQPLQINNAGHHHSILIYLATEHSSKDAYEKICWSTARNFSGAPGIEDLLSFHKVESLITELTGIEKIQHDMCFNSCTAFTGPYSKFEECPLCGASCWNQELFWATNGHSKVPAKRFTTIPLGP